MSRFASRKFLLAASTLASASALVYFGHIADGAYIAGNVAQKATAQ